MTLNRSAAVTLCLALGSLSALLILGALLFEYGFGLAPCELCMAQRYPHYAAILAGVGGGLLLSRDALPARTGPWVAGLTLGLVALSGAIGVYHAGVEWHFWAGPAACTGNAAHYAGGRLDWNATGPKCDVAAWRLLGISMAGYNALISLGASAAAAWAWATKRL